MMMHFAAQRRLRRFKTRLGRVLTHSTLSYHIYSKRYLAVFALIGLFSILLEIALVEYAMPGGWPWLLKATLGFVIGLVCSFVLNATANFRVPRQHLLSTFGRFAAVSFLSFVLNMGVLRLCQNWLGGAYAELRLITAGSLFVAAYLVHRHYTFDLTRNFGIALYASVNERVHQAFYRVGRTCDHVHVDLIDETMNPRSARVDLSKLRAVRKLWRKTPICLHVMSLRPLAWFEQTWDSVDWLLFHVSSHDDPLHLIRQCRLREKKVGVVWHYRESLDNLFGLLPHVDFVMVLGIAEPGRSGQPLLEEVLEVTAMLNRLKRRYGYEVMFDGGVNASSIARVPARYVVAASAVLHSENPIRSVHHLKSNARYGLEAA